MRTNYASIKPIEKVAASESPDDPAEDKKPGRNQKRKRHKTRRQY